LLLDRDNAKAYYYRVVNGTCTLLTIDLAIDLAIDLKEESERLIGARRNIATIIAFSDSLRALRKAKDAHQLSLMSLGHL
jgi:hypothetical protein